MEIAYDTVITVARTLFKVQGLKFTFKGLENFPAEGGAVIAVNHTGYLDFTYAGYPAFKRGRYIRFMAKKEVFDNSKTGPIMRALKHIPVDRVAGADAFQSAVEWLKRGELVGVYPEATISRSFELKEFKSGAARMAIEANTPIIPVVIWGAQRVWTKGHPKRLGRTNTPIHISIGEPIAPFEPASELTAKVKKTMQEMLLRVQDEYGPHPQGAYWVPRRLGGSAPTLEEANVLDQQEAEARIAARRSREQAKEQ